MVETGADSAFKIAQFDVNPLTNTISSAGRIVRVRPKVMELIVYLARNAGNVVDKESIMRDVWAGVFVTSEVLANAICAIRELFGDDARNPCIIETIQKRGYRLIAPVSSRGQTGTLAARGSLTVGHERETAELEQCLSSAVEGRGLLVCVSGEPGIGKTTIIEEFLFTDRVQDCVVGRGKCSERFEGTGAYLPILEALESLTRADTGGGLDQLLRRAAPAWYVQVFPNAVDAGILSARTAGSSQERLKRELTTFLREVSNLRPLLLFIDDLHWADASSADILSYLCDRCSGMRMLIITAYRPEFLLSDAHVFLGVKLTLQAHGVCREIKLDLLSRESVALYIEKAFPGHRFPGEFVDSIYSRTEGNPLFMVDLLNHLRDRGVIVREAPRQWRLVRSLSEMECGIPPSVHSLIESRLRLLDAEDRRLLECAAIHGYEFDSSVTGRALRLDAAETEERLARMDRVHGLIRLVRPAQLGRQVPVLHYQFVHVLYQNVLGESLSPSRRAQLSAAVAEALLEIRGEKNAAVASQAALLFDAARDSSRAASYYLVAAKQALEVSADREAAMLARHGLRLLKGIRAEEQRDRLDLFLQMVLGTALIHLFGYADPGVREAYSRAYALCRDSEDNEEIYQALMGLGAYHIFRSDIETGREIWERLLRLGEASGNPQFLLWSYTTGSIILSHLGDQSAALRYARAAFDKYAPQDHVTLVSFGGYDPGVIGRAQASRILWLCGYPDQARKRAEEALALARDFSHPYTLGLTLFFTGWAVRFLRDTTASTDRASEAKCIAEEHGFQMLQGWSEGLLGWGLASQGRLDEGLARLREGLRILRSIGSRLICNEFLVLYAEVQARRGERKEALATLDEALAHMQDGGERYFEAELYRTRAEVLLQNIRESQGTEIESLLRKSLAVSRKQGSRGFELRAATTLGRFFLETGSMERVGEELRDIYSSFGEGLNTPDLRDAREVLNLGRQPSRKSSS